jgi:Protein of unknown function (DUF3592)
VDLRPLLILLFTLPLGAGAIAVAAQAWRGQRRANAARAWPHTSGRVDWSGVQKMAVRTRSRVTVTRYRRATRYAPCVIYSYTVDGVSYQAEQLHMGQTVVSSDTRAAERVVARYPAGGDVMIYYNPADPADATLDPRTGWGTRVLWMVALVMLVVMIGMIVAFASGPPIRAS